MTKVVVTTAVVAAFVGIGILMLPEISAATSLGAIATLMSGAVSLAN